MFDLSTQQAALGIKRFDLAQGQRVPIHSLAGFLHADFRIPSAVDYTTFLRATRMITRDEREALMASPNSPTRGHPKLPQAARSDYDASAWMTKRAAASLSL